MDRTAQIVPTLGSRWLLPRRVMVTAWLLPPALITAALAAGMREPIWLAVVWNVAFAVPGALRWWSFRRMARANDELRMFATDAVAAFGPFTALWLAANLPERADSDNKVDWVVRHWEATLRNLSGRQQCYTGHEPGCTHHPIEFSAPRSGPLADMFRRLHAAGELRGVWLHLRP